MDAGFALTASRTRMRRCIKKYLARARARPRSVRILKLRVQPESYHPRARTRVSIKNTGFRNLVEALPSRFSETKGTSDILDSCAAMPSMMPMKFVFSQLPEKPWIQSLTLGPR